MFWARKMAVMVLAAAMTLVLGGTAALGQASSSSDAVGKITDATGATIPDATVHLINNANGAERTLSTNSAGEFSAPNLPPANYRVRVEKAGFKTSEVASLDVEIGKTANASIVLSAGGASEVVEVTALPPQLQTSEATVGQVIDQKQINDLPLNGRNVLQLATLAAGVSPSQTANTGNPCAACGSRNLYITVDGGRASSTNYVLDGTYIRSVRFNTMSMQPSTDTLQEFNLLRSTFSTEYGQGQAVVSMVTKSGSNQIHGTGFEFARNAVFDARNFFTTYAASPIKPSFSRNQYGGTIGAPIKKDKLFVFGGYEGLRTSRGLSLFALYPTQAQLSTLTAPNALSNLAAVLNPTFPTPNGSYQGGAFNYTRNDNFVDNFDVYTVRADQTLSQRNSLFERFVNFNSTQFTPAVQGGGTSNPLVGRNGVIGDTFLITPRIVNEVRVGYNFFYNFGVGVATTPGTNYSSLEGLQNVTALNDKSEYGRSAITITSFAANSGVTGSTGVSDGGTDQGGNENILSFGDSLSVVRGRHTFKFGGQFQNRRVIQKADNNGRGSFTFGPCTAATGTSAGTCDAANKYIPGTTTLYTALQNYQRGYCTASCNGNAGTTLGHYRDNTYGAFLNDVWQVGHGLTVNAGLRWEYNAPWVEQNGLEGTLEPTTGKIKYSKIPTVIPAAFLPYVNTTSTFAPGIINPNKKGFGPRLGVAYEATPGTVFRAGYGIYFDNLNTNELQFTRYAAPLYYQQSFSNVSVQNLFPDPTTATVLPAPFSILPNNSTPYTMEWNLSIQQDLGHGIVFEMAYTGSETHKLWKRFDQNMDLLIPNSTANQGVRPFTQFQHGILTSSTEASANFHGGSVKVEKRAKNGLYILGNYQWSKNLDNNSGEADANDTSYSTNFAFDHSYSNFDVRNRAVISGGYELPFGKGKDHLQRGIGNALAGGWSLQPAVQLRTGYPFSISRSGATFGVYTPGRVNLAPGRTTGTLSKPKFYNWFDPTAYVDPGGSLQGNVTRNTGRGPGTAQVDLSGIKNFAVSERIRMQFRAEAYNVINHANFSNPASNISTASTVGKITSTSLDNRDLQLALKVLF